MQAHPGHEEPTTATTDGPLADGVTVGHGDWTFQTKLGLYTGRGVSPQLGAPTHGGVAVDKAGAVYATIDQGEHGLLVYRADADQPEPIGPGLAGGHSLRVIEEDGRELLLMTRTAAKEVVKLDLSGNVVSKITQQQILAIDVYNPPAAPDGTTPSVRCALTSAAMAPDGSIFVADGYGSKYIHKFGPDQQYIKTFGGPGKAAEQLSNPHGVAIDHRYDPPRLLVCDRENHQLKHFDLDGNLISIAAAGLRSPCYTAIQGDYVAVAELQGRVTILDADNQVVAHLGQNDDPEQAAKYPIAPSQWRAGLFVSPHGICWRGDDLLVAEWNASGRLTKLVRVPE